MEEKLKIFIVDQLLDDEDTEVTFSTSLFKDKVLDSINLVHLISFIEGEFGIKVSALEISFENLDTINNMVSFIKKKKGK